MIHVVTEAKPFCNESLALFARGIWMSRRILLKMSLRFVSRFPVSLCPSSFSHRRRYGSVVGTRKTQLVFRSRMCGVDIPKTQRFKLSSRCLVYRLYVLRRALFARPRCYQSYYVYDETRSPLDGGRWHGGKESQKKQGRSTRRRWRFLHVVPLPPPLGTVLTSCLP